MKSGGLQIGEFFLVVEFAQSGSALLPLKCQSNAKLDGVALQTLSDATPPIDKCFVIKYS